MNCGLVFWVQRVWFLFLVGWTSFVLLFFADTVFVKLLGRQPDINHFLYTNLLILTSSICIFADKFHIQSSVRWVRILLLTHGLLVSGVLFDFWRPEPFWAKSNFSPCYLQYYCWHFPIAWITRRSEMKTEEKNFVSILMSKDTWLLLPAIVFGLYNLVIIYGMMCNKMCYGWFGIFIPFRINEMYHFVSLASLFLFTFFNSRKAMFGQKCTAALLILNALFIYARLLLSGGYYDGW